MSRTGLLLLLALLYPFAAPAQEVHIIDPWIKEAPPGVRVMAGYLLLENRSSQPCVLTGVRSPAFDRVEIHRSVIEDDVVRMEAQNEMLIAAHDTLAFQPGGYHLMLYDPRDRLTTGEMVELQFKFADGSKLDVTAEVRRETGGRSDHHDHHHHHH
jgi:periplasmic copper chaperone A